jgi:hypothetical protein
MANSVARVFEFAAHREPTMAKTLGQVARSFLMTGVLSESASAFLALRVVDQQGTFQTAEAPDRTLIT